MRPLAAVAMALLVAGAMAGCITVDVPAGAEPPGGQATASATAATRPSRPQDRGTPGGEGPGAAGPGAAAVAPPRDDGGNVSTAFEPHVVVAAADTGINPYHELFFRPERTEHPCTYIQDFPCDLPALELSIGKFPSWREAVQADLAVWRSIRPGDWFWIPQTAFVAVGCGETWTAASEWGQLCILDENDNHGTGVTSAIVLENPGALLVFAETQAQHHILFDSLGAPIDVYSHSNGFNGPSPYVGPVIDLLIHPLNPIYVVAAGNRPDITYDKYNRAHPDAIAVGGGYAQDRSSVVFTTKTIDVASYFCRPAAPGDAIAGLHDDFCGTSAAAPTVAGAVSKVILALRTSSGYTGGIEGRMVDPLLGISIKDVRDAVNRTASYEPPVEYALTADDYDNSLGATMPVPEEAPWAVWGWGFYDGLVADATIAHLQGAAVPDKPAEARQWQETQYAVRTALYDW